MYKPSAVDGFFVSCAYIIYKMNKRKTTAKWILFALTIIINAFIIYHSCMNGNQSSNESSKVAILIKDIIKKNKIIYDKKFNVLTIIALSIIIIILLRSLIDTHFLCNNLSLKNIIDSYQTAQYGYASGYNDSWEWFGYINQNMKYFISLIILLLIYRKINIEKKTNK